MAKASQSETSENRVEQSVSRVARGWTDVRTIAVGMLSIMAAIFFAGVYYKTLTDQLNSALATIAKHEEQIEKLTPQIDDIVRIPTKLSVWSPESAQSGRTGLPGGDGYGEAKCPDGYYAVGIKSWGSGASTKYCVGCLVAVELLCRPLNLSAIK